MYLDVCHKKLQSFRGKLYNPERKDGAMKKSIAEKIAGSGLPLEDLKNMLAVMGKKGSLQFRQDHHHVQCQDHDK